MSEKPRNFTRAFKLGAVSRLEAGERAAAVAAEVGVRVDQLYRWRRQVLAGGAGALRGSGRPRRGLDPGAWPPSSAEGRVAEMERKLGRQALEIDFLDGALQRIEASRRPNEGLGGTASSPRSRR